MQAESKHRVGFVGSGNISEYHAAALRRVPNAELVGVYDLDPDRAAQAASKFKTRAFSSLEALCDEGANVIHVLTPPDSHASVALEALRLGCHVLVEKPLATEVEDCRRIAEAAEISDRQVCVNHSLLFDPHVRRALNTVRSGKIGKVVSVDILRSSGYPGYRGGPLPPQYREAGYPFRDLGVHALYLFQALLGPIEKVDAAWQSLGGDPNLAYDEWRATVKCRNGLGQFQLSWNVKPLQNQIIIQGTGGVLRVDLFLMFQALRAATPLPKPIERILNAVSDSNQSIVDVRRNVIKFLRKQLLPYHGLQDLVKEFYHSLDEGGPVPISVSDATQIVQWTEQIARAADAEHLARLRDLRTSQSVPVLVTGASGALGSAVVERLRRQGLRVRLFVRRIPPKVEEGTEVVIGNLGDPAAVNRAVQGARTVVHIGAAMKGDWDEHYGATVVGTENVLRACREYGVEKLVHISSLSVIDWAGGAPGSLVNESTPYEPQAESRGAYTQAKLEAEKLVLKYGRDFKIPTVILRPGLIYGGRLPLLTPAIARKAGDRYVMLGNGKVTVPLIYIEDVVDAIVQAMNSPLENGEIIQLVDDTQLTQNDVLRLAAGPDIKVTRIPRPTLFAAGKLSEYILGLLKRPSPISAYRLRSALANRRFDSLHAQSLLGWTPRVGVCDGIRRSLREHARPD